MDVRGLNRRSEQQQQNTAKSNGQSPGTSHALFALWIEHLFNYSVRLLRTYYIRFGRVKRGADEITQLPGERLLPIFPGPSG
jgi:hypothetical protein